MSEELATSHMASDHEVVMSNDDLLVSKIVALFIIGLIKLIAGLAPLVVAAQWIKSGQSSDSGQIIGNAYRRPFSANLRWKFVTNVALCIGCGLLMATIFVHMLPEVRAIFVASIENGRLSWLTVHTDFPLAELTLCIGFLLILLTEYICHGLLSSSRGDVHGGVRGARLSFCRQCDVATMPENSAGDLVQNQSRSRDVVRNADQKLSVAPCYLSTGLTPSYTGNDKYSEDDVCTIDAVALDSSGTTSSSVSTNEKGQLTPGLLKIVLMILALSVHAVFEGIAAGLQTTTASVWVIFVTIIVHSVPLMFCIGFELVDELVMSVPPEMQQSIISVRSRKVRDYLLTISAAAVASSLGVLIGTLISLSYSTAVPFSDTSDTASLVMALMQGIASGTLLYVTTFEVLAKLGSEFKTKSPLAFSGYFVVIISSFIAMVIFMLTQHDDHH